MMMGKNKKRKKKHWQQRRDAQPMQLSLALRKDEKCKVLLHVIKETKYHTPVRRRLEAPPLPRPPRGKLLYDGVVRNGVGCVLGVARLVASSSREMMGWRVDAWGSGNG